MSAEARLTDREREIVDGIRRHLTYAQIGAACLPPITEATVRTHTRNILEKIRVDLGDKEDADALPPRWAVYVWATAPRPVISPTPSQGPSA